MSCFEKNLLTYLALYVWDFKKWVLDSYMFLFFSKRVFDSSFLNFSLFLFFLQKLLSLYIGRGTISESEARSFEFELFTVDISSCVTPARFSRARLNAAVQSSVALLGAIRCFLGHGLGRCPKNLLTLEVNSVRYEQICVDIFLEYVKMLL